MLLVVEARHVIVGLGLELGAAHPPAGIGLEERQPAAMDQVVDEGGDEDGLAGPRQAGHAEPERRRHDPGGAFGEGGERQPCFIGDGSELQSAPSASRFRERM